MLIYKRCGCEVRPLQIGGAHTCACAPKSGRARCVRATQKMVATNNLPIRGVGGKNHEKINKSAARLFETIEYSTAIEPVF